MMLIETKYKIGDKVWVVSNGKPTQGKVRWIDIHIGRLGEEQITQIRYRVLSYETPYNEDVVFSSEKELRKNLKL